ncbi:MAG: DUF3891 family protein [Acetobacteraceae bacterium]|nr:DUF3891 family protein [Acetobacteraceae bacterium]
MILWPQPDSSILATPQPAHALISGQLMRVLAERPEPFEPAVTAAAMHDCAWLPWEANPEFDEATGLPRAFNALSGEEHVSLWQHGVQTALAAWGLWVGLLVMRHGSHIYRLGILNNRVAPSPSSMAAMEAYWAWEKATGAALMAELGTDEAKVAPLSRQVAMVDAIALGLCWGQAEFDCAGTTLRRTGPFAAALDPWPLACDAITVETEALVLPARFDNAAAMREGLARATRRRLRFDLRPA